METNAALAPEIIWFSPSEEYLEDPRKMLGLIHQSSATKGMLWYVIVCFLFCFRLLSVFLSSYYGVDLDDDETGVWVMGEH